MALEQWGQRSLKWIKIDGRIHTYINLHSNRAPSHDPQKRIAKASQAQEGKKMHIPLFLSLRSIQWEKVYRTAIRVSQVAPGSHWSGGSHLPYCLGSATG